MRLSVLASALGILAAAAPPDPGSAQEPRLQTIEDVLSLRSVGSVDVQPAPDLPGVH